MAYIAGEHISDQVILEIVSSNTGTLTSGEKELIQSHLETEGCLDCRRKLDEALEFREKDRGNRGD